MDLLRLTRFFVTIVEEGHFGHAARRLGMTQPPLSQGLQRLEAELGTRLVHRGPRGLSLTEAGAALLPQAQRLLQAERDLRETAHVHSTSRTGVRIGVAPQLPPGVSAALASACSAAAPTTPVSVHTAPTTHVIEAVSSGRLDYGVVLHPAVLGPLEGAEVIRLTTELLLPEHLASTVDAPVRLRDVLRLPLALPPRDQAPAAHDLLIDTLHQHGITAGTVTVDDDRSALALVATGQACALTADPLLNAAGVARRPVPGDALPLRVRVVRGPASASGNLEPLEPALTAVLAAHADTSAPAAS
jgi:DNA-binding transcriptional LysR family regulator